MTFSITPKGQALSQRLPLENPCEQGTPDFDDWHTWALSAVYRDAPPTQHESPAAHEGYAWGASFNAEWSKA